jgi:serine/threonine protein kinase
MSPPPINPKQVFLDAIEQFGPDQWPGYLEQVCAHNLDVRHRVEALLEAHIADGSLLDNPAMAPLATMENLVVEKPGTQIGPYKLLEQIGEGGFGVVFLAEQERPVRRRVALKIIKPGMDTRQVIARFEAERQALAMMDHPNIAKVLDAGMVGAASRAAHEKMIDEEPISPARLAGPTGRPYFVMELVQGVPITEYCDECNLTTRERLELFITVCQAVQHAHQKGIIHRDLKPTNVLVAIQDGHSAPKIIDFGVAKAIDQQLTEHTLTTAFAQMVGTPLYMSPEQAELSPLGVDTRSDIYSLGVMLYELLTGTTPFDKERLHAAPFDELRRIVRDEEPPRPSARISTLASDRASTVAGHRRTDARHLSQQVCGELDWIVMKCLEKDRNGRYETPNSLARDIERYLDDEPVQACPPSAGYRFRKFARRNKSLLAAGSAIAAALVIGLGLSTWMYFRATTENARAQAVSSLLRAILASSNPDQPTGSQYNLRELSEKFSSGLGDQLADYHFRLGELLTRQSRAVFSPEDAQRLAKDAALRLQLARRHFQQAIEAYDRVALEYPDDFERRQKALLGLVEILKVCVATPSFDKEIDEVNRRLEAELPKLVAAFPDSADYQLRSTHLYTHWSNALASHVDYLPTTEYALSELIEIVEKLLDSKPNQPDLWIYLANAYVWLGDTQWRLTGPEAGEVAFRRAMEIYDEHEAEFVEIIAAETTAHEAVRISSDYTRLAYHLACAHRKDEAAELVRQAALHVKRVTDPVDSVSTLVGVALVQLRLGDVASFRETCKAVADVHVADADNLTKVRSILPCCCGPDPLDDMGMFVERAVQIVVNDSYGQRHVGLYVLGAALYRAGDYLQAAERLEESIDAYPESPAPGHDVINWQRLFQAMTKWKLGEHDDARRLLAETLPALDKEMQSPSCVWIYRLGLELLRSEAVAMIEPKDADKAVENGNLPRTNSSDENLTPDT